MIYTDIITATGKTLRVPNSHPILSEIEIDPVHWEKFLQLRDEPGVKILGHEAPHDGWMTIYVACASELVKDQLDDGWHGYR